MWKVERVEHVEHEKDATEQRLHDLALCLVIPWRDGWPGYWLDDKNEPQRFAEIIEATKAEPLWQI